MASYNPPTGAPASIWLRHQPDILAPAFPTWPISHAHDESTARISPGVLAVVLVLAFVFFTVGLVHLRRRLRYNNAFTPPRPPEQEEGGGAQAIDSRQLRQLFRLHDSGLDQSFIDSLPVFSFRSIVGPQTGETFDCPVCLSEFADHDKLRLLPQCSHAFHLSCIDTWLLANSSCPLCRGSVDLHDMHRWIGILYDDHLDGGSHGNDGHEAHGHASHDQDEDDDGVNKVFNVRLGKFKRINCMKDSDYHRDDDDHVVGVSSGSSASVDDRRCFSMGAFEYVVGEPGLRVKLAVPPPPRGSFGTEGSMAEGIHVVAAEGSALDMEGRRLNRRSRGDSFSFSKIWLWPKGDPVIDAGCDSRARLVAGSSEGYTGHVDGESRVARMNHPKSFTVDGKGNVYVADSMNMAIRKISDSGITTVAGGKWSRGDHVDGPSEDAKFSNDFEVLYIASSCSLLVVDRGKQAIREIQLHFDDCVYQNGNQFSSGIPVLVGAVFFGYMVALLQTRVGTIVSPKKA